MSNVATPAPGRTWQFPTRMISELTVFTALIWLGFVIIVMGLAIAIDRWGTLSDSLWEESRQVAQWFLLFMGVHIGSELLPQYITHGKTRRDFFIESGITVGVLAAVGAALVTAGWLIERAVYAVLDVEQHIDRFSIFNSATDYPLMFVEALIVLAVWIAGGLFIAASWYRNREIGLLAIIPAMVIAAVVDLGIGMEVGPIGAITRSILDADQPPLAVTLLVAVAALSALGYLSWRVIRDIPIRNVAA